MSTTGTVLSYSDFENMRTKKKKGVLILLLSILITFFLFKDAFALYGTTYLPNGQKAYKDIDTGQVIAPCECKCDLKMKKIKILNHLVFLKN